MSSRGSGRGGGGKLGRGSAGSESAAGGGGGAPNNNLSFAYGIQALAGALDPDFIEQGRGSLAARALALRGAAGGNGRAAGGNGRAAGGGGGSAAAAPGSV